MRKSSQRRNERRRSFSFVLIDVMTLAKINIFCSVTNSAAKLWYQVVPQHLFSLFSSSPLSSRFLSSTMHSCEEKKMMMSQIRSISSMNSPEISSFQTLWMRLSRYFVPRFCCNSLFFEFLFFSSSYLYSFYHVWYFPLPTWIHPRKSHGGLTNISMYLLILTSWRYSSRRHYHPVICR